MSRRGPLGPSETALLRRLVLASAGHREESQIEAAVDWRRLVDSAERHRLAPLALEGARRDERARAPIAVLDRLQNIRNLELARAVVRLHHVEELGALAFQKRMDLFLLKGAAFSATLYRDPGTRPMSDIDLLVDPSQFDRWAQELDGLGYAVIDSCDHAICYRRRQTGVLVELHRALTSSASFLGVETESFRERSMALDAGDGVRLRTLSWEDHLIHLALHASFQHGFRQPAVNAWDARTIAERTDFDLRVFLERARQPSLAPWIFGGLAMCEALFESPRLTRAVSELGDALPARLTRIARSFERGRLLAPGPESVFGSPFARIAWSGFRLKTLFLLMEISRPRSLDDRRKIRPSIQRLWKLTRTHGLAAFRPASRPRPYLSMSPTPASLGEVRDV